MVLPWWEGLSAKSPWATQLSFPRLPSKQEERPPELPPQEQLPRLKQRLQRLQLKQQLPRPKPPLRRHRLLLLRSRPLLEQLQPRRPNLQLGKFSGWLAGRLGGTCIPSLLEYTQLAVDNQTRVFCHILLWETICCPGGLRNLECVSCLADILCVCVLFVCTYIWCHIYVYEAHCLVLHRLALTRRSVAQSVDRC